MKKIANIIEQIKHAFSLVYKQELVSLILFGSQARGDAKLDSGS